MTSRLREDDSRTLECMAEYRMLTVTQLAAILQKSKQTVRRRINDLENEGLVEVTGREFGRGRDRPENSLGLTEPGVGMQGVKFIPDAVFGISDSVAEKTCLFFLEVDRGTETIASPKRDISDIRQKIINYQWYFQSRAYRRYEEVFKCQL